MYARSTLKNYADRLPEAEKETFNEVVSKLRGVIHGNVEIILASDMNKAGLGEHVTVLEKDQRWLFLTNSGEELTTLYGARYESRHS